MSTENRKGALPVILNFLSAGNLLTGGLNVGMDAPDFALPDQHGTRLRLSDYRGDWVVLYFYPKDNTPGCTTEACRLRDDIDEFRRMGVRVAGLSTDSTKSHAGFAYRHSLPFPLLADQDGAVAASYGALWKLGPIRFARRHTFIISPAGKIAGVYRDVNPRSHSQELIDDLKRLQSGNNKEWQLNP